MKEIKEKIDVNSLVPAPLDNKNVMLDWWKENMFDDENYSFKGNVYLGFIAGLPVMATIKENVVTAKCIPQILRTCEDLDLFTSTMREEFKRNAFEIINYPYSRDSSSTSMNRGKASNSSSRLNLMTTRLS